VFNNEQTFFDWQVQDYRDTDFSMSTAGVRFYEGESVEYELECVDEDGVSQRSVRRAVEGNTSRGEYYVWSTCEVGTFAASVGVSISPLSKPLYLAQPFEVKVDSCSLSGCEDVVLYLRVWGHEETDSIEAKETFTDFTDPGDRRDAEFEGKALVNFPAGSNANFQLYCEGADGNNHPGDSVSLPHGNYEEWLSCSTGLITVSVGIEVTN
jgi:hypothetical protein